MSQKVWPTFCSNFKETLKNSEHYICLLLLTLYYFVLFLCFCPSGVAFIFGTCLSGPEEHSKKEGEDKNTLFCPHCVQSAERDVEYQNDPKVEEVLSQRAPSYCCMILCKWTILLWYDHPCTSASFWSTIFGLLQTQILWNTNALFEKNKNKICLILWFKGCTGIHGCVSTCLLFLCLFTFWISQSRLQLLLFLLKCLN